AAAEEAGPRGERVARPDPGPAPAGGPVPGLRPGGGAAPPGRGRLAPPAHALAGAVLARVRGAGVSGARPLERGQPAVGEDAVRRRDLPGLARAGPGPCGEPGAPLGGRSGRGGPGKPVPGRGFRRPRRRDPRRGRRGHRGSPGRPTHGRNRDPHTGACGADARAARGAPRRAVRHRRDRIGPVRTRPSPAIGPESHATCFERILDRSRGLALNLTEWLTVMPTWMRPLPPSPTPLGARSWRG